MDSSCLRKVPIALTGASAALCCLPSILKFQISNNQYSFPVPTRLRVKTNHVAFHFGNHSQPLLQSRNESRGVRLAEEGLAGVFDECDAVPFVRQCRLSRRQVSTTERITFMFRLPEAAAVPKLSLGKLTDFHTVPISVDRTRRGQFRRVSVA